MENQYETKCQYCGYESKSSITEQEIRFAKLNNSKTLHAVWICPKCGKDNVTEFEIPD